MEYNIVCITACCRLYTTSFCWLTLTLTGIYKNVLFFLLQKPETVFQETLKSKRSVIPVKERVNTLKNSVAANQTSVGLSSPFRESMRCKNVYTSELNSVDIS